MMPRTNYCTVITKIILHFIICFYFLEVEGSIYTKITMPQQIKQESQSPSHNKKINALKPCRRALPTQYLSLQQVILFHNDLRYF